VQVLVSKLLVLPAVLMAVNVISSGMMERKLVKLQLELVRTLSQLE
jgi:hypothetical protein